MSPQAWGVVVIGVSALGAGLGVAGGLMVAIPFIARRLPGIFLQGGGQLDPAELTRVGLPLAWYEGGSLACRRCNVVNANAGQLASCPGCGFAGGELPTLG